MKKFLTSFICIMLIFTSCNFNEQKKQTENTASTVTNPRTSENSQTTTNTPITTTDEFIFTDYEAELLPEDFDDLFLLYLEAGAGSKNPLYYLINANGEVKICEPPPPPYYYLTNPNYVEMNNSFSELPVTVQVEKLSDTLLYKLARIDISDVDGQEDTNIYVQTPEIKMYSIAQTNGFPDNKYSLYQIGYYQGRGYQKCTSPFTEDICDYIDYAVSEAKKQF